MDPKRKPILQELKREFEVIYGDRLVEMILYGSQARGDARWDSDIDVLVVLEGEVSPGEEIANTEHTVAEVSLAHDVVVQCVFVSTARFSAQETSLTRNVRHEGVPV